MVKKVVAMTSCCNDYGKCKQGFNCPARPTRSEYDANKLMVEKPIQYMPKIQPVKDYTVKNLMIVLAMIFVSLVFWFVLPVN